MKAVEYLRLISDHILESVENSNIVISGASGLSELYEAYRFVQKQYVEAGWVRPNMEGMRYTKLQLLPSAGTAVARVNSRLVGTASIVVDEMGLLPSTPDFPDVFAELRDQGRKASEATLLACIDTPGTTASALGMKFLFWGLSYAFAHGVDDWCVLTGKQSHTDFWNRGLGFDIISDKRPLHHFPGVTGQLLRFDMKAFRDGQKKPTFLFRKLVGDAWLDFDIADKGCFFSAEEAHSLLTEMSSDLLALYPETDAYLAEVYPEIHDELQFLVLDSYLDHTCYVL